MKKIWWMGAMLALALAACSEKPQPSESAAPVKIEADTSAFEGDWILASLSQWPPDPGTLEIRVKITHDHIFGQSGCKHFAWTYTVANGHYEATPDPASVTGCAVKSSMWEDAFDQAIGRGVTASLRPDGKLLIRGPGGEALLKRS